MRRQLRPFHSPEQLAALYASTYDHTRWPDHIERVAHTATVLDRLAGELHAETVADLSCGDGAIIGGSRHPWKRRTLGDMATTGIPIEKAIAGLEPVDVFVCSETLEHIENPDGLLAAIRSKARGLLLTTPADEQDDSNPEHYWSWGVEDLKAMLAATGWGERTVELFTPASIAHYTFQVWTCR